MLPALALTAVLLVPAKPYPVQVAAGRHFLVLMSDGSVTGWGPVDSGQLGPPDGIKTYNHHSTQFVKIKLPQPAKGVAASSNTSAALLQDGTVVTFGAAALPPATPESVVRTSTESPTSVPGLDHVVQIVLSGDQFAAVKDNGTVWAWGIPRPWGDGRTPQQVPGLTNIKKLSVTDGWMALDKTGKVFTFPDYYGVTLGRKTNLDTWAPVANLSNVVDIAAGNYVDTAVKKDGTVWVWGSNNNCQLGNGHNKSSSPQSADKEIAVLPVQVKGVANAVGVAVSGGGRCTFVLTSAGTLYTWGSTELGQGGAGIASGSYQKSPIKAKITGVKAVWAAGNNGFALKTDNSFWAWGGPSYPKFPFSSVISVPKPFALP